MRRWGIPVVIAVVLLATVAIAVSMEVSRTGSSVRDSAAVLTSQMRSKLEKQIQELLKQVVKLQKELTRLKENPSTEADCTITRVLIRGSRGSEVSCLQQLLAQDSALYPEGEITGYFGPRTEAAVQRFQRKYNLVSSGSFYSTGYGSVGPLTRSVLFDKFQSDVSDTEDDDDEDDDDEGEDPDLSVRVRPSSIDYKDSATVSWSARNVESCTLRGPNVDSKSSSGARSTGELTKDATYVLKCKKNGGGYVIDRASVDVESASSSNNPNNNSSGTPTSTVRVPKLSISVTPPSITAGEKTTVVWSGVDVESCTVTGTNFSASGLSGSQMTVTLTRNTAYTLTCKRFGGGTETKSVAVAVRPVTQTPLPSLSITATPATIQSGAKSTIAWSATNVASCVVAGTNFSGSGLTGSKSTPALTNNATYTLTCTKTGGGTETKNVAVTVTATPLVPVLSITATPVSIQSGQKTTISWTATNVASCTVTGTNFSASGLSGSQMTVALTRNTTYTLACVKTGGGTETKKVSVAVTPVTNPTPTPTSTTPVLSISASPSVITSGQTTKIEWSAQNVSSCSVSGTGITGTGLSGSKTTPTLTRNTTYTLSCVKDGGGTVLKTVSVAVTPVSSTPAVSLTAVNAARKSLINSTCAGGYETCYEGNDLPGQGGEPYQLWDNPLDDGWKSAVFRNEVFRINQKDGSRTYLTIDRTAEDGPGWIMRRDEFMTYDTGAEINLSLRIPSRSTKNGIALLYHDRETNFGVSFNPDSVIFNSLGAQLVYDYPAVHYAKDLSAGFNEFVIRKEPASDTVNIYSVSGTGSRTLILGNMKASRKVRAPGEVGYHTTISIGDNQDDRDGSLYRGAIDLDFLRFKRASGGSKTPIALPAVETNTSHFNLSQAGDSTSRGQLDISGSEFLTPFSLEWKMRFKTTTPTTPSYNMLYLGNGAGYTVDVGVAGVRAFAYARPVSSKLVKPSGYDPASWNCFRLVRPRGSLTAHLYMNNSPVPVLTDIKGTSSGSKSTFAIYGKNVMPVDYAAAQALSGELSGAGRYPAPDVELAYVKYSPSAFAPSATACDRTVADAGMLAAAGDANASGFFSIVHQIISHVFVTIGKGFSAFLAAIL